MTQQRGERDNTFVFFCFFDEIKGNDDLMQTDKMSEQGGKKVEFI